MLLIGVSIFRGEHEQILGMSSLLFGTLLIAAGFLAYLISLMVRPARPLPSPADIPRRVGMPTRA